MIANSLLDIWGLLLGWNVYGEIWDMLNGTGLAYLPFLVAVIKSLSENYCDKAEKQVKSLEQTLFAMVLVLMFTVIPFNNFATDIESIDYVATNTDCAKVDVAEAGNDTQNARVDTVATEMVGGAGFEAKTPILWGLVQQYSAGMTYAAIKAMGCSNNFSDVMWEMRKTQIVDDGLQPRVADFYQTCFLPASKSVVENGGVNRSGMDILADTDWIGSETFLTANGSYYNDLYMTNMQEYGFVPDPTNHKPDEQEAPGTANPYCSEVWLGVDGQSVGLKAELLEHLSDEYEDEYDHFMEYGYKLYDENMVQSDRETLFLKLSLQMQGQNVQGTDKTISAGGEVGIEDATDKSWYDGIVNFAADTAGLAAGAYVAYDSKETVVGIALMAKAFQIALPQLVTLAQIILILAAPIVMVATQYTFKSFFQLALTFFAFEFINAILALGMLIEDRMAYIAGSATFFNDPVMALVMAAISLLQIFVLPLLWLAVIVSAGAAMVRGQQGAASMNQGGVGMSSGNFSGVGGRVSGLGSKALSAVKK